MMGSGRMWLAPSALEDPRAVKFTMQGQDLPTEFLLKQYLPQVKQFNCTWLAYSASQLVCMNP